MENQSAGVGVSCPFVSLESNQLSESSDSFGRVSVLDDSHLVNMYRRVPLPGLALSSAVRLAGDYVTTVLLFLTFFFFFSSSSRSTRQESSRTSRIAGRRSCRTCRSRRVTSRHAPLLRRASPRSRSRSMVVHPPPSELTYLG